MSLDELFPLRDLPNRLPKRNGKKVHFSTLYRWSTTGCRGRKLRTVQIGGGLYTSMDAVEEFVQPSESVEPTAKTDGRKSEIELAEAELDSLGIK